MQKMRFASPAIAAIMALAAPANAATLEASPIPLGGHHCTEIWSKPPQSAPRNKFYTTTDLSNAGRDSFKAACAARGGVYSPGKCPRQNIVLVCQAQSRNAMTNVILYQGSADEAALAAACPSGSRFSGKGAWYALRSRPGRQIWASCTVP